MYWDCSTWPLERNEDCSNVTEVKCHKCEPVTIKVGVVSGFFILLFGLHACLCWNFFAYSIFFFHQHLNSEGYLSSLAVIFAAFYCDVFVNRLRTMKLQNYATQPLVLGDVIMTMYVLSNISVFVASVYLYDDITASLRIWDTSLTVNVCQLTIFLCWTML